MASAFKTGTAHIDLLIDLVFSNKEIDKMLDFQAHDQQGKEH